jgi:hypothetical protein
VRELRDLLLLDDSRLSQACKAEQQHRPRPGRRRWAGSFHHMPWLWMPQGMSGVEPGRAPRSMTLLDLVAHVLGKGAQQALGIRRAGGLTQPTDQGENRDFTRVRLQHDARRTRIALVPPRARVPPGPCP